MNYYKQVIPIQLLSDLTGSQYRPQIFDLNPVLLDSYIPRSTRYNLPVKHTLKLNPDEPHAKTGLEELRKITEK